MSFGICENNNNIKDFSNNINFTRGNVENIIIFVLRAAVVRNLILGGQKGMYL